MYTFQYHPSNKVPSYWLYMIPPSCVPKKQRPHSSSLEFTITRCRLDAREMKERRLARVTPFMERWTEAASAPARKWLPLSPYHHCHWLVGWHTLMAASGYYGNSLRTAAYCQFRCTSAGLMDSQHGNKIPAVLQLAASVSMDWSEDGIWSLISVDLMGVWRPSSTGQRHVTTMLSDW